MTETESNLEFIHGFANYFRKRVETTQKSPMDHISKKSMYFTCLDALKKVVDVKTFTEIFSIADYPIYNEIKDKISISHLERYLDIYPEKTHVPQEFIDTIKKEIKQIDGWTECIVIDKSTSELLGLPETLTSPIQKFKHSNLLHKLRNRLVHDARANDEFDCSTHMSPQPYYETYLNKPGELRLVYPCLFFEELLEHLINVIEKNCREKNLDPHTKYTFGPYLIDELNETSHAKS